MSEKVETKHFIDIMKEDLSEMLMIPKNIFPEKAEYIENTKYNQKKHDEIFNNRLRALCPFVRMRKPSQRKGCKE